MRSALAFTLAVVAARACVAASPADVGRAVAVQQSVQDRFWDARRQLYVNAAGGHAPADMWSCGIACSALVAAAGHDPGT